MLLLLVKHYEKKNRNKNIKLLQIYFTLRLHWTTKLKLFCNVKCCKLFLWQKKISLPAWINFDFIVHLKVRPTFTLDHTCHVCMYIYITYVCMYSTLYGHSHVSIYAKITNHGNFPFNAIKTHSHRKSLFRVFFLYLCFFICCCAVFLSSFTISIVVDFPQQIYGEL